MVQWFMKLWRWELFKVLDLRRIESSSQKGGSVISILMLISDLKALRYMRHFLCSSLLHGSDKPSILRNWSALALTLPASLLIFYTHFYQKRIIFCQKERIFCIFMATTADFRIGMIIRFNGELNRVEEYIHRTPGNLRAFVQAKLRSLKSGRVSETRFRSGEEVEEVRVEQKQFQYLYHDGQSLQFMDKESYDQMPVDEKALGEGAKFLKEGETVQLMMVGHDIVGAEIPFNVELKVVETEPGVRGNTATGSTKPAKVETGATVNVPLFINEGDVIRVDTRSGAYLERVKN